jgi:WXG100 family type VII secretion target
MADVYISIQNMNETVSTYARGKSELESILTSLKSGISSLENQWKGEARDNFSLDHFPKLCDSIEGNIKKLERLESELREVASEFNNLDKELRNLNL